jgi:hypothetical protein
MDEIELVAQATAEAEAAPPIHLVMPATRALKLLGLLQLAIRHPKTDRDSHEMVQDIARQIAAVGPAFTRMIKMGFDREFD